VAVTITPPVTDPAIVYYSSGRPNPHFDGQRVLADPFWTFARW
jgi:hypothetical protein